MKYEKQIYDITSNSIKLINEYVLMYLDIETKAKVLYFNNKNKIRMQ